MNMLTLLTQELKSLCVFHVYLLDLIVEQGTITVVLIEFGAD